MIRMLKACDQSQWRLAKFLIVVVIIEVTLISYIIRHEHTSARKDWSEKLMLNDTLDYVKGHRMTTKSPLLLEVMLSL